MNPNHQENWKWPQIISIYLLNKRNVTVAFPNLTTVNIFMAWLTRSFNAERFSDLLITKMNQSTIREERWDYLFLLFIENLTKSLLYEDVISVYTICYTFLLTKAEWFTALSRAYRCKPFKLWSERSRECWCPGNIGWMKKWVNEINAFMNNCWFTKSCLTLWGFKVAACQVSLSFTISWSLLKFTSTESTMLSTNLILCHPLLILPSIFPNIRAFSSELVLCIRWSKYWSFSFSINPSLIQGWFLSGLTDINNQFSSVVSDSLWPHESQHARPPCPSPTPGVHWDSLPSSQWCHPVISSSVIPFSSLF